MKRIVFFARFSESTYSGGRIAVVLMAEALVRAGHAVDIVANALPPFMDAFSEHPSFHHIRWVLGHRCEPPADRYPVDVVLIVPQRTSRESYAFYLNAVRYALAKKAALALLNFESWSWFRTVSRISRTRHEWNDCYRIAKYMDRIISISQEGTRYARQDYGRNFWSPDFVTCYPCINSFTADAVPAQPREKSLAFFSRWEDPHKNSRGLVSLLDVQFGGYTIHVVSGSQPLPTEERKKLIEQASMANIHLVFHVRLTEPEKYILLKSVAALVFISEFEGFGLLPIESRYCNTPCVAFDLPVLREVNGDNIHYAPLGDFESLRQVLLDTLTKRQKSEYDLQTSVLDVADIERAIPRMEQAFINVSRKQWPSRVISNLMLIVENLLFRVHMRWMHLVTKPADNIHLCTLLLEKYLQTYWANLLAKQGVQRLAVYGCGAHTQWLEQLVSSVEGPCIVAVLDDFPVGLRKFWSRQPMALERINKTDVDAILISSDSCGDSMRAKCRLLYPDIPVFFPYQDLPLGPYPKR